MASSTDPPDHELNKPVPYTLHLDEKLLNLTNQKLKLSRFPEEQLDLADDDWSHGAKVKEVKKLAAYWENGFDWRAEEARINAEFSQFTVKIDIPGYGLQTIHFAHQLSSHSNAIPLLFVQGWPGSFLEARKLITPLTNPPTTTPPTQAFNLIVPSIPGFGPGPPPLNSGFGPVLCARAFKILMVDVLGYNHFLTQGGDWGAFITRSMTLQFPQHVRACHYNFVPCGPPPWYKAPLSMGRLILNSYLYTPVEKNSLKNMMKYRKSGDGYLRQQSTKPQSLGFGLGDSPIGLLGWLLEKFHEWTDSANYDMPADEILTFVMMHWMQGATPGLRFYKAAFDTFDAKGDNATLVTTKMFTVYCTTPTGISLFPKEIALPPRDWVNWVANVKYWKEHDKGGHFAAVEYPEELVADLREWFGSEEVKVVMAG